jgi:transcriptional antiterminator NusG
MSLQEPQEEIERAAVEETADEENAPVESSSSELDAPESTGDTGSIDAPAETEAVDEEPEPTEPDSDDAQRKPPTESLPSSSDSSVPSDTPEGPAWYVIHCYSGYENKVRHNLEQRIETMGMKDKIFDVVIPTQEEIEVKDGKRRTVERHIFPGYVLVNMALTEESWYVVRNTPGVTGFVGMGNNPTPLRPEEVAQIVKRMEAEAPTVKVSFKVGERVRIVDGPFNDFRGVVSEIDMERTKVRVMVSFFGRETPVELDFLQVEKS